MEKAWYIVSYTKYVTSHMWVRYLCPASYLQWREGRGSGQIVDGNMGWVV